MRQRPAGWTHAAKVAMVATGLVAAVAVVAALVLNAFFVDHLSHDIDARLVERLANSPPQLRSPPTNHRTNGDLDDPPSFVWSVTKSGAATALTPGAPRLATRSWSPGTTTQQVAGTTFRMDALRTPTGWLVAGESVLKVSQARFDLIVIEVLLGTLLLVVTFVGAFVVGLRASAPIEQIRRRQAEFTADASHELRTPLSVIEAEVDLALSRPRDEASYRGTLRRIGSESERLRSIVEDLLWLARAEGQVPKDRHQEPVDLVATAESCIERFRAVADAASIDLHCTADFRSATVRADAEGIDRLVSVLLDNACRYAGTGGTVAVRIVDAGARVGLSVEDSGPGIPEDHYSLVFDRFHRVDEEPGGTGLGLAIADTVVRSSGGSWSIGRSALGGARMGVLWRQAQDPVPNPRSEGPAGRRPPRGSTTPAPL